MFSTFYQGPTVSLPVVWIETPSEVPCTLNYLMILRICLNESQMGWMLRI